MRVVHDAIGVAAAALQAVRCEKKNDELRNNTRTAHDKSAIDKTDID
jgi:hypothetical protein